MAIAFDQVTDGGIGSGTTLTQAVTIGSGLTDPILFASVWYQGGDFVTGVTYNGTAMTQIGKVHSAVDVGETYLYYSVTNLGIGSAHNVVVTNSDGTFGTQLRAMSYSGASQTSIPDSFQVDDTEVAASPYTISTTVVGANAWLVGGVRNGAGTAMTASGAQTTLRGGFGGSLQAMDSNLIVGTGSQGMTVTFIAGGAVYGVIASFVPPSSSHNLLLMGVGT